MATKLTEHFALEEFTKSGTATRLGLSNIPNFNEKQNLISLCKNVLEPLREFAGQPVIIGSGFRCEKVNTAVGGVKNSQHRKGEAADIHLPNNEIGKKWFDFIRDNLEFDQLIWEKERATSTSFWIHVSFKRAENGKNRKQVINYLLKYK